MRCCFFSREFLHETIESLISPVLECEDLLGQYLGLACRAKITKRQPADSLVALLRHSGQVSYTRLSPAGEADATDSRGVRTTV